MPKHTAQHFNIHPSKKLLYWLIASHIVAVSILLIIAIASWMKIIAIFILFFILVRSLIKNGWLFSSDFFTRITINAENDSRLISPKKTQTIILLGESMVTPWLITLHYRSSLYRFAQTLVLFSDSMSEKEFRQLRVYLRLACRIQIPTD